MQPFPTSSKEVMNQYISAVQSLNVSGCPAEGRSVLSASGGEAKLPLVAGKRLSTWLSIGPNWNHQ